MSKRRALIIDDWDIQGRGIYSYLQELGDFEIDVREDVEGALQLLDEKMTRQEEMYSLVLSDMQLPERKGGKVDVWAGANLLHIISKNYSRDTKLVLYTCKESIPNTGDLRQIYQATASALYGPYEVPKEKFLAELKLAINGALIISEAFKKLAQLAADPETGCPYNPVLYYCIRLISESRGKKGAAEEWNRARQWDSHAKHVTDNIIDELLGEIYSVLPAILEDEDFSDLSPDQKKQRLATWYWNEAIPRYGAAVPVNYEPPNKRKQKWPLT